MTAVVITELLSEEALLAAWLLLPATDEPEPLSKPPDTGFKPKIQTRCWSVYKKQPKIRPKSDQDANFDTINIKTYGE